MSLKFPARALPEVDPGSAARTSLGGDLAGLILRYRRSGLVVVAVLFLAYLGWDMLAGMSAEPPRPVRSATDPVPTTSPTSPGTSEDAIPLDRHEGSVAYSIDLDEITGLSPVADPGSIAELWVTWDRPLTRVPKLQSVVRDAVLAEISPPITADGPTVATFLVSRKSVERLLLAERYGSLSATVDP